MAQMTPKETAEQIATRITDKQQMPSDMLRPLIVAEIESALLAERERCARIADFRGAAHKMQIAKIKKEHREATITLVDANGRNDEDELIAAAIREGE